MTKENVEKYLTNLTTAAEMLGCSRQAVAQYVERGDLSVWCPGSVRLVLIHEIRELAYRLRIPGRKPMKPEYVKRRIAMVNEKRKASQGALDKIQRFYQHRDNEIRLLSSEYAALIKAAEMYEEKTSLRQRRNKAIKKIKEACAAKIRQVRK